jgi:hypothetical protein
MSQQTTRQIALVTVFATCMLMLMVALVVGLGLNASPRAAFGQVVPLAVVCAGALVFLLSDPFRSK